MPACNKLQVKNRSNPGIIQPAPWLLFKPNIIGDLIAIPFSYVFSKQTES
jgi:hypothetical protein